MSDTDTQTGLLTRVLLGVLVALVASFAWLVYVTYHTPSVAPELGLDRVYQLADQGQIRFAELLVEDDVLIGQRCTPTEGGCEPPLEGFQASYPEAVTNQLLERLSDGGAEVEVDEQTPQAIARFVSSYVYPVLLLAVVFGLIMVGDRGGDGGLGGITGFGSMDKKDDKGTKGAKAKKDEQAGRKRTTFEDVGGIPEVIEELREVTDYLEDPERYEAYGAAAPRGVLLFGPPGCGKTLLARAVAGEAEVPFFTVSGAEFVESLVGVGAARVRDLFRQIREAAPAMLFIDEIDAVGRKRSGEGLTGGEREQTVNQLLVEMDGFEAGSGIVLIGATNRPDILDPALMRPGRFDRHVTIEPPAIDGRREILKIHAENKPLAGDVDLELLAERTPGFTGADLANVINEGALLAIRQGPDSKISMHHLREAVERVLHGPTRRGNLLTPEERRRLAYHESGHALVAAALGEADSVQRVSILARGRGLGSSLISSDSERVLRAASQMRASLTIMMAGTAAEQLIFSETSTSAEDDLDKANTLAREMVGVHGMSEEVGPLRLLRPDEDFLGGEARLVEAVSGNTLALFDAAVRAQIDQARAEADRILTLNRDRLDALAGALEDHETLEGDELEAHLAEVPQADVRPPRPVTGNGEAPTRTGPRGAVGRPS